jgi:hypothetical protein
MIYQLIDCLACVVACLHWLWARCCRARSGAAANLADCPLLLTCCQIQTQHANAASAVLQHRQSSLAALSEVKWPRALVRAYSNSRSQAHAIFCSALRCSACRLCKPLACRLLPLPSKRPGEPTGFEHPYMVNSRVMDLDA